MQERAEPSSEGSRARAGGPSPGQLRRLLESGAFLFNKCLVPRGLQLAQSDSQGVEVMLPAEVDLGLPGHPGPAWSS